MKAFIAKLAAGFIIIMLACTLLGKQIDRLMTPVVRCGYPSTESLNGKTYETVIPSESLVNEDNKIFYIYMVEEQKSISGTQYVARKHMVTRITYSHTKSAISIPNGVDIIRNMVIYSSKPLADGLKVRIEGNE